MAQISGGSGQRGGSNSGGAGGIDDKLVGDEAFTGFKSWRQSIEDAISMIMFYIVHDYKPSSIVQLIVVVLEDNGFYTYYWGRAMRTIYDMPPQVYVAMQPVEEAVEFDLKIWLTVAEILIIPFFFTFVFVSISVLNRSKIKLSVDILRTLLSFVPTALFQPLCMMILNSIMCSATNWCGVQVVSFYAIYGSVLLVLLVGIASISMSKFFDANPTHRNLHGFAHGRVSSIYYKVKFVAAAAYTFSHTALWIKALTAFLAPTIMLVVTLHFMPNYNLLYNRLRAGFYGGHAFSGLLSLVSWYIYTINGNQQLPIYVFYSMHLTWITGFVAMFWFAEHQYYSTQAKCHKALVRKLEAEANPVPDDQQTSEDHEANKYVFESWEQVEITARMFISYMTERRQHVEFQDLEEIHKIFKRGLVEFPEHPQLLMSYATYIYYLESHTQEATRYLRKLALLNPPAAIKFQLFCFKQSSAQVQEVDELGDGVRLDVTTYAEFRKIDFMARQQHSICESALHELWSVMMRKHVNMEQQLADIEAISIKLYAASNKADRYYSQLVGRFPKSVNYLRLYSKFAYEVMGDTNKGNALTTRAKLLERDRGSHERLYTPMTQPKKLSFSHPAAQPSRQGGAPLQSVVVDSGRDKGGKSGEGGDNDNEDDGDEAEFTVMSIDEGMNVQAQSNSNLEPRIGTRKRSLGDGLDAKSGTSRSSSEQAMSTMRDSLRSKLRGELNVLRISAILITLILIAIYCVMYGEFYYHVQKIASGLDARIYSTSREYLAGAVFRRTRLLRELYATNNVPRAVAVQYLLANNSRDLAATQWWLYSKLGADELAVVDVNATYYPTTLGKQKTKMTMFQIGTQLSNAGFGASTIPFSSLANLNTDNNYNFVVMNFPGILNIFESANGNIFKTQAKSVQDMLITVTSITVVGISAAIGLIYLYILKVGAFIRKQRLGLSVFTGVSRPVVRSQFKIWEEIKELDVLGFGERDMARSADKRQGANARKRSSLFGLLHYFGFIVVIVALAVGALYFYFSMVSAFNANYVIAQVFGLARTYTIRAVTMVHEIVWFDANVWTTWNELVATFLDDVASLKSSVDQMIGGSQMGGMTAPGVVGYDQSLLQILVNICLPTDGVTCAQRATMTDANYLQLRSGLARVTLEIEMALDRIANNIKYGGSDPTLTDMSLIEAVFYPDSDQGWQRMIDQLDYLNDNLMAQANSWNLALLIVGLIVAAYGMIFVLQTTIQFCDRLDAGIVELIVRMPPEVKAAPCFQSGVQRFLDEGKNDITISDIVPALFSSKARKRLFEKLKERRARKKAEAAIATGNACALIRVAEEGESGDLASDKPMPMQATEKKSSAALLTKERQGSKLSIAFATKPTIASAPLDEGELDEDEAGAGADAGADERKDVVTALKSASGQGSMGSGTNMRSAGVERPMLPSILRNSVTRLASMGGDPEGSVAIAIPPPLSARAESSAGLVGGSAPAHTSVPMQLSSSAGMQAPHDARRPQLPPLRQAPPSPLPIGSGPRLNRGEPRTVVFADHEPGEFVRNRSFAGEDTLTAPDGGAARQLRPSVGERGT